MSSTNVSTIDLPYARSTRVHRLRRLAADRGGAVAVEYIVLVGTIGIVSIPAFIAAGMAMVESFESMRAMFLCPLP